MAKKKSSPEKIEVTVPAAAPAVPAESVEVPAEVEAPVQAPVVQAAKAADDYQNHPKFAKFKTHGGL